MRAHEEPGSELWRIVRTIYRTALKRLNARLSKEGITFSQYSVLLALARNGPMKMSGLGEHMLVAPANVTGLVDRMEKRGWVVRRRDRSDRRLFLVELTPLGGSVFKSISGRFQSYVRSIGSDLTGPQREATMQALRKVLAAVERTEEI